MIPDKYQSLRSVYYSEDPNINAPQSETVNVAARFDSSLDEYVVLWSDIQAAFNNVLHVRNGKAIVQYLADKKLTILQPLRFSWCPSVVFDVIIHVSRNHPAVGPLRTNNISSLAVSQPLTLVIQGNRGKVDENDLTSHPSNDGDGHNLHIESVINTQELTTPTIQLSSMDNTLTSEIELTSDTSIVKSKFDFSSIRPTIQPTPPCEHGDQGRSGETSADKVRVENHPKTNYEIGLAHFNGDGTSQDYIQAKKYFLKAAIQGHAGAQNMLGHMYHFGFGCPEDYHQAREWYIPAAHQGCFKSQFRFGDMYYFGQGVSQDYYGAWSWYEKAANHGYAEAQYYLGIMAQAGKPTQYKVSQTKEWYQKAADQGHSRAQYKMGSLSGNSNISNGFEWYLLAAQQGCAKSQNIIGSIYRTGQEVAVNESKAEEWFQKAAIQEHKAAQRSLTSLYKDRQDREVDYSSVVEWYQNAADQGNAIAQCSLGDIYKTGSGVPQDYNKAIDWYRKSEMQGYEVAQCRLGTMYEYGYGVS
ncbi:hypothetical protein BGZ49_003064 [Haplosporangium sp. Z 27]|nr:hypothetical protein BGZ49_003064 [Haplosporangium sp. Z 27]